MEGALSQRADAAPASSALPAQGVLVLVLVMTRHLLFPPPSAQIRDVEADLFQEGHEQVRALYGARWQRSH